MEEVSRNTPVFLSGGGQMGNLMRSFDWSKNPLGEPAQWPQSLKTTVGLVLRSGHPMAIWWGPELIQLYNDAYRPLLGNHHPALGQSADETWANAGDWQVEPIRTQVLERGETITGQNRLFREENGSREDLYHTYSIAPLIGEQGIAGLLYTGFDTPETLVRQERLKNGSSVQTRGQPAGLTIQEQVRTLFMQAPVGISIYRGPERIVELINERMLAYWHRTLDQALNKPLFDVLPEVRGQGFEEILEQVYETGTPFVSYEMPATVQRDGHLKSVFVKLIINPLRGDDGAISGLLAMAYDITDLVQARLVTEQSDQRFRDLIEQAPAGMAIMRGPEFIYEIANRDYLRIVDRPAAMVLNKPLLDVLPELTDQRVVQLLQQVLATGEPFYGNEFPVTINRHGKPELGYFNFVYQPIRETDGTISRIMVVANDVTELVRSRQIVQESERQFRDLVMESPFAMAIFRGPDYRVELVNDTLLKTLWRRERHEVQGQNLLDLFPELLDQPFPRLLRNVFETGLSHRETEAVAYIVSRQETYKHYLDFEYAPLFDPDGSVSGIMVTVNDVTEKVEARMQIGLAEQRSRLAIDAAEMGTYDWDIPNGTFIYSDRLPLLFGLPSDAPFAQRDFSSRIHPDDQPIRTRAHQEALRTGRLLYEARIVLPDQSLRWVRVNGKVLYNSAHTPQHLLGTVIDITEQKRTADELEKRVNERTIELQNANEELVRTNYDLEQFAYIASHDLQEPLRKIQTFTELLQNHLQNAVVAGKYFEKIQLSAQRMSTLIQDVLDYSRLAKTVNYDVAVDLTALLEVVKTDFELSIEQKHATVRHSVLPVIRGNPPQLNQLFFNLIGNSLKFSEREPLIEVWSEPVTTADRGQHPRLNPDQAYVKLLFKDNGIGFDQQYADQIFTIFHRLHGRTLYSGTGIGLALCRKIVENHKGVIVANSALNQGATFTVYLPDNEPGPR